MKMYKPKMKLKSLGRFSEMALRLLRSVGRGDFSASYADADEEPQQPKTFNVQAYLKGKRRMHEIETRKAMILLEMRHDRWKAGGPL